MKIYAQIETTEGILHIDEILALPAVSGIFIGPNDLAVDSGSIGNKPKLFQMIRQIAQAANQANKPFGIITTDEALINVCREYNVKMISVGSELNMMINGCRKIAQMKEIKGNGNGY